MDEAMKIIMLIPAAYLLCALISVPMMLFMKGKPTFGVVKMRVGMIYARLIDMAVYLFFGVLILILANEELKPLFFIMLFSMACAAFMVFATSRFRITYDEQGFEYRGSFGKTSKYTYKDITNISDYSQPSGKVAGLNIEMGKKIICVTDGYLGGAEFVEFVKQRTNLC